MKKMPYAIIFIIILAILVFAGCKTMVNTSSESESEEQTVSETESEEISSTEDVFENLDIESLTDENGETLFSDEEISSMKEEYSSIAEELSSSIAAESSAQEEPGSSSSGSSSSSETTTKAQSSETTTKKSGSSETTTKKSEETTTKAPAVSINEYDVMRSGRFYMDGTMYADGEANPVTLAVSDDLVYMQTTMDGATMGFLISSGSTYLLNPTEKTYCEFGSILSGILSQAGMMSQEEIMEYINEMGFSTMEDLSKADQTSNATMNGTACKVYVFNKSDGTKTRVFMNGNELLGFEMLATDNTVDTATYINTITQDIPTLPPADYTKQNIITFMTSMEAIMGE